MSRLTKPDVIRRLTIILLEEYAYNPDQSYLVMLDAVQQLGGVNPLCKRHRFKADLKIKRDHLHINLTITCPDQ